MPSPPSETATSRLRDEHRVILRVADVLQALLATEQETGSWDFDAAADCIAFFRRFADLCHHGKEEDLLFPELQARGMPRDAGPIAVMLYEHQQGRAHVGHMREALDGARAGDEEKAAVLRNAASGYLQLIRGHILKEDNVLFEMADQLVQGPTCRSLCDAYGAVCARRFEGQTKQELEALAADLERRAGLA